MRILTGSAGRERLGSCLFCGGGRARCNDEIVRAFAVECPLSIIIPPMTAAPTTRRDLAMRAFSAYL
jgi:hypothetical protein